MTVRRPPVSDMCDLKKNDTLEGPAISHPRMLRSVCRVALGPSSFIGRMVRFIGKHQSTMALIQCTACVHLRVTLQRAMHERASYA